MSTTPPLATDPGPSPTVPSDSSSTSSSHGGPTSGPTSPTHTGPASTSQPNHDSGSPSPTSPGASIGYAILAALFLLLLAIILYTAYRFWNARRRGLQPPPINPFSDQNRAPGSRSGVIGWVQDKFSSLSRQRRADGAYEGTSLGAGGAGSSRSRRTRGFGAFDPDEAWDARVGAEADVYGPGPGGADYFEEQELSQLSRGRDQGAYSGTGYGRPGSGYRASGSLDDIEIGEPRGRQAELDRRYDEETGRKPRSGAIGNDPFGDAAEPSNISLRGVSPRPHEDGDERRDRLDPGAEGPESPISRRSMFRENM